MKMHGDVQIRQQYLHNAITAQMHCSTKGCQELVNRGRTGAAIAAAAVPEAHRSVAMRRSYTRTAASEPATTN